MTSIDARVRAEQIRVIYQQAPPALLISTVVSAGLGFILWNQTDRVRLAGWFAMLALLALGRMRLVRLFRAANPEAEAMPKWERRFVVSLVLTGIVWGVGGWLIMPPDSIVHQAVVYFFLMGMAGGAVASYSAHAACTYVTISFVLLPSTAWFVFQDNTLLRAMAAGGLVYVAAAYRATRTLSFFLHRTFQLSHELQIANERAEHLARTDPLTGMRNRRAFYEQGELALDQASRYGRPLSLIMLDIDHFKMINDTWGHAVGDEALRALAGVIARNVRAADIAGRLGGEEFAIVLPETTGDDAASLAERLRSEVEALAIQPIGRFTCSFGVAERDHSASLDALLARADAALYDAKEHGRNRVAAAVAKSG